MKNTLLATAIALSPSFADAQEALGAIPYFACQTTETMFDKLESQYGETRQFCGTSSPIHLDCHWRNADTGTWSNTRTNIQQDMTCILTSGDHSHAIEQPKPEVY